MSSTKMIWMDQLSKIVNDQDATDKMPRNDSEVRGITLSHFERKKVEVIRKSEYLDILKKRRETFVMELFSKDMEELSRILRESAEKMEVCNQTRLFPVAEWLDLPKIEKILQEYFRDLGYTVISQIEEKENKKTVKITLS